MRQREYIEGPEALENFERGMKAVFQVPKSAIVAPTKKKREAAKNSYFAQVETLRQGLEGNVLCRFPVPVETWRGESFLPVRSA